MVPEKIMRFVWPGFAFSLTCHAALSGLVQRLRTAADVKSWEVDVKSNSTKVADAMAQALSAIFIKAKSDAACLACQAGIRALRTLTKAELTREIFLGSARLVCSKVAHQETDVCKGLSDSTGTALFDVFQKLPLVGRLTPPLACHAIANVCPMPEIKLKQLSLPAKKKAKPPKNHAKSIKRILHLTDIHFETDYQVGAEADCNKPICCQSDSSPNVKQPAREWGEYKCDANQRMLNSLLKNAASRHNYEMLLFTGDIPAHDIWKESPSRNAKTAARVFDLLQIHFPTTPIYPAIGNHEPSPLNQFPLEGRSPLYSFMAKQWKKWIPNDQLDYVQRGGYYAVQHSKDLTVLVLNTNIYYKNNYYTLLNPHNNDPHGMFHWLISKLQTAEEKGARVYITAHIPPGSTDFYQHWSDAFHHIILRYSKTIIGQFYGHLHYDEFELFYNSNDKSKETAVNVAFLAPSMSTLNGINPSYRVYDIDQYNQVMNYRQFYANLRNQQQWKSDANWELLYSAAETYSTTPNLKTITPTFLHQATVAMASNQAMFDKFWAYRKANGEIDACDGKCQERQICTLRAGKSRDNCAIVVPFT